MRGKMEHPEKYFCQVFTSPKTTTWTYVPPGEITPAEASPPQPEIRPQADPTSAPRQAEPPPKEKRQRLQYPRSWRSGHATSGRQCSRETRLAGSSIGEAGAAVKRANTASPRRAVATKAKLPAPFVEPLGYEIGPLKPATVEYGPRFSSCLISERHHSRHLALGKARLTWFQISVGTSCR